MRKYVVVETFINLNNDEHLTGTHPLAGDSPKEALEKAIEDYTKTTESEEGYKLLDEFWGFGEMTYSSTAPVCTAVERIYLTKERNLIKARFTAMPIEF